MNSQPITDMLCTLDEINDAIALLHFMNKDADATFRADIETRLEILNYERKDIEYMLVQEYESMNILQVFTDLGRS